MTTQGQNSGNFYKVSNTSPRVSPFRRPEGHASSPLRQSTPSSSLNDMATSTPTPRQYSRGSTPILEDTNSIGRTSQNPSYVKRKSLTPSSRAISPNQQFGGALAPRSTMDRNVVSKLQPAQVRELREAFQILDRDSDGYIGREDIADMLTQLGLSASSSDISSFFPSSAAQTVTLPVYLNSIADKLSELSPPSELISAFSAFDEDDSGQVDLSELKNAVIGSLEESKESSLTERDIENVITGFTERRALRKQVGASLGKRGEVFKYLDFVASVTGGLSNDDKFDKDKVG